MKLRQAKIQELRSRSFDVLIIGGGINGTAAVSALSAKGAAAALIEKKDFASATSQESSNLVWGGIKYLKGLEFALVRRLCKSRNKLIRSFPSSVIEIRFLAVIGKKNPYRLLLLFFSTILYWLIGGGFTRFPRYFWSAAKLKKRQAVLNTAKSSGGIEYSDAWLRDSDTRFVFHFIRSALDHGAAAANYVKSTGAVRENGMWIVKAKDIINQEEFSIRAKVLINACGPYADEHNKLCSQKSDYKHLFSKGIHLLVPALYKERQILTFFADDGRPYFVIPMENMSCIGTTDTRVESPNTEVSPEDREFLLDNINRHLNLPRPLGLEDIAAERCGVRPLVVKKNEDTKKDIGEWTELSRKHVIEVDKKNAHVNIYGGKLSDCVNIGGELCQIMRKLKIRMPYTKSRWYGEPNKKMEKEFLHQAKLMDLDAKTNPDASSPISGRLWRLYGINSLQILEDIRREPALSQVLFKGTEYLRAELHYASRSEMVVKLEDFLRRRTSIALTHSKEDIFSSPGLTEACRVFFDDEAEKKKGEYFSDLS